MGRVRRVFFFTLLVAVSFAGGVAADRVLSSAAPLDVEPSVSASTNRGGAASGGSERSNRLGDRLRPRGSESSEYANLSAAELFERALSIENDGERGDLLQQAAEALRSAEITDAVEWAGRLENEPDRTDWIRAVVGRLSDENPEAAIALASELPRGRMQRSTIQLAFRQWIRSDVDGATRWALQLQPGAVRNSSIRTAILEISSENPERALTLASHLGPMEAGPSTGSIFRSWAEIDPAAAAARAAELTQGQPRSMALEAIARRWVQDDPEAALGWARALESPVERRRMLESTALEWSYNSPAAAFRTFVDSEELPLGTFSSIAATWVRQEPLAATERIEALPEGPRRQAALRAAASEMAMEHPHEAARLADLLPSGSTRASVLESVAFEMTADDAQAAATWAEGIDGDEERQGALTRVVSSWVEQDVEAASAYVERMPAGAERDGAVTEMMWVWGRHDPAAAARWLQRHGGDERAVGEVTRAWAELDPERASRWASTLDQPEARDNAMLALSNVSVRNDAAGAWAWASRIDDPSERADQLAYVAREWRAVDPDAARARVDAADLTPETRARVLGEEPPPSEPSACHCLAEVSDDESEALEPDIDSEELEVDDEEPYDDEEDYDA